MNKMCPGPPLKKMLFPVQRPGDFIMQNGTVPSFFLFCPFFIFILVKISSFSYPKKKNGFFFAAAQLATILATHFTGNKLFFKGGPVLTQV